MKISNIWLGIITLGIIVGVIFFAIAYESPITGKVTATGDAKEVQIVKLSVSGSQYILEPSTVKKGTKVRLEADISKIPGCAKSIVIPAFNIRKSLSSNDQTIEFTPDKAGTFNLACTMNMYHGTLTVLESDGKSSKYVEAKPASGGMVCGGGAGGCGCGG